MKKKITVKDVAIAAGVSQTSVSLVLNNRSCNIPETTKQHIRNVADELEYVPSHIARSLVTKRTKTIGVIIPDISNTFFSECVRHIQIEFNKYGYDIFLCDNDEQLENDIKYIKLLSSRNVDALILTLSAESLYKKNISKVQKILDKTEIPFVLLDRYYSGSTSKVLVDNEEGGYLVAKYLLEKGHKNIGVITGPLNLNSSADRLRGVERALLENGLKLNEDSIYQGQYDIDTGHCGGLKLLDKVSAIFAFNDLQAFGVLEAAKEKHFKIPRDVSLIGFDDVFYSSILETPLTTVRQPVKDLAIEVCNLVLRCIKNPETADEIRLSTELIIRESVKNLET